LLLNLTWGCWPTIGFVLVLPTKGKKKEGIVVGVDHLDAHIKQFLVLSI
jgi:hypothetical protein